jgi:RimJ/RimL family protein N-acetyltransferase
MSMLFQGELIRLAAPNPETDAEAMARWMHDSEYARLLDTAPARMRSAKYLKAEIEKSWEKETPEEFFFLIRALADDHLIGLIELDGIRWTHGDCWVGIGLGEREYWGKGYGTDAMRVILRYAFDELNLHRVSLSVFGYNTRAIRSYEKAGFVIEGCARQFLQRDGRRWDIIFMGILREEWESRQA